MTRILIVGAGATGGALGARLAAAHRSVTFLVRERRAELLADHGLRFRAPDADLTLRVPAVTSVPEGTTADLVIVAVKAPAIPGVIRTMAPAIGPDTRILPLLNGMAHVDALAAAFPGQVLGGVIKIVATLDDDTVVQMTPLCTLTIGSLDGRPVPPAIPEALDVPGIDLDQCPDVQQRLWDKWAFIAAAGVITCLFRGSVGDILAAGGRSQVLQVVDECEAIAAAAGHPVTTEGHALSLGMFLEEGSEFTSSLYRDLHHGDPLEAEHILGDLAARGQELGVRTPLLDAALLQLRTHHRRATRAQTPVAPDRSRQP